MSGVSIVNRGRQTGAESASGSSGRKKPKNGEHQEQVNLFRFLRLHEKKYPVLGLVYAIPNGGKRDRSVAVKLKAEGVRAGVSDIHVPVARDYYHGLWIEMKYGKNTLTEGQLEWLSLMREHGHRSIVCWSWVDAAKAICCYLGLDRLVANL